MAFVPIAQDGQPTGENFAAVDLTASHDLGLNMTAVRFASSLSAVDAASALARIQNDPRVKSVEFDHQISFGAQALNTTTTLRPNSAVKVATPAQSVRVANAWTSTTPLTLKSGLAGLHQSF